MILSSDGNTYENQLDFTLAHSPGMSNLSLDTDGPKPTGVQVASNYPTTTLDTSTIPATSPQDVVGASATAAPSPIDKLTGNGTDRYQTWPEKAVRSVIDAFKLPGDVYSGEEDPSSEHAIGRAAELAGALIFGPAPIAKATVDGTLGSIAGISAKNLDNRALAFAKVLDFMKFSTDEIYNKTGMFKGSDGNWRFELPSESAIFNPPKPSGTTLSDTIGNHTINTYEPTTLGKVLDFPDLYKAYPQLENLETTFNFTKGALGHYHPDEHRINLNLNTMASGFGNPTEVALHEVQHAIQHIEGFNYGVTMQTLASRMRELMDDPTVSKEGVLDIVNDFLKDKNQRSQVAEELYNRSPGEREAKVVETRANWSAEEKSRESPMATRKRMDLRSDTSEYKSKVFPSESLSAYPAPNRMTEAERQANIWMSDTPLKAIANETRVNHLKMKLGQMLRDKSATKKTGYDVESSDYMHYNTQIRALRSRLKELNSN